MAHGACDTCLRCWIVDIVVSRIVEGTAEEGHRIVTSGTKTGCMNVAIPGQQYFARVANTGKVSGIVEGTEAMC